MLEIFKKHYNNNIILCDLGLWQDMIHIALNSVSIYTVRRGSECVSLLCVLLCKSHSLDKTILVLNGCFSYLHYCNHRIEINTIASQPHSEECIFPEVQRKSSLLIPAINLCRDIFCKMLDENISCQIMSDLVNRYGLKLWCWNIITEESENIEVRLFIYFFYLWILINTETSWFFFNCILLWMSGLDDGSKIWETDDFHINWKKIIEENVIQNNNFLKY